MGWDRKRKGSSTGYFYTSVRTPEGVKKVYHGRGVAAQEAAADIEDRRSRQQALNSQIEQVESLDEADRLANELFAWADMMSSLWLILTGHHYHRGSWRRSHDKS